MHRWLFFLGLFPLSLAGCYHDDEMDRSDWGGRCDTGVAFQLSSLQDLLDKHEPTTIRVCFDRSCDQLTLFGRRGQYCCEGAPGGPPDQLTWCDFSEKGDLSIAILRIDDQEYGDNAPHTAAISIRDGKGQLLFSHAEAVRFRPNSCGLREIRLAAPEPQRVDNSPPPPPPPPATSSESPSFDEPPLEPENPPGDDLPSDEPPSQG
ncbi:MAG: hypothetical protein NZX77_19875 [Polyangiaceae bacterium]|nr:hypothetical protein [Polyangiaceae bacterium]